MKTRIIKRISTAMLTVLLVIGSVNFAKSEETKINKETIEVANEIRGCSVPSSEIVIYLEGYGYSNITFYKIIDPCTITIGSDYEYDTVVYLSGSTIVGHEDDDNI